MDNKKKMKELEMYQEQIKELFKEMATPEVYDAWVDTFQIEDVTDRQVIITCDEKQDSKAFKKECQSVLDSCIATVLGDGKKVKVYKKNFYQLLSPKLKKNIRALKFFAIGMVFVCIAAAMIIMMCSYIGNRSFRETFYSTSCIKVDSPVRVIQLSDLHGVSYGKNNQKLLERVEALEPDIILCTGDMLDSVKRETDEIVELGKNLSKIAPSYYIYGNNEVEDIYDVPLNEKALDEKFGFNKNNRDETALLKIPDAFEKAIEKTGMKVLKNEKDTIEVKNMTIDVYGVLNSNPSSFWSYSEKAFFDYIDTNPDNLKITAVHEPFIFETFSPDYWGDLMVCGHTHGGVMRIPVLGPLVTHEGGLFPERKGSFVKGRYDTAGRPLIVSGGLENSNIFRINNKPELVIIDINKF